MRCDTKSALPTALNAHGATEAAAPQPLNSRAAPVLRPRPSQDGRVTDHRVPGATIMGGVDRVLSGGCLGELIDAVIRLRRDEALEELLGRAGDDGSRAGSADEA